MDALPEKWTESNGQISQPLRNENNRSSMKSKLLVLPVVWAFLTTGCATNYLEKYYVDTTRGAPIPKSLKKLQPQIYFTQNVMDDLARLKSQGYALIGYSDYWTSNEPGVDDLRKKAKEVGATIAVCQIRHRETVTQYKPMFNWVPGTTSTYSSSGSVSSQGSFGAVGNGWSGFGVAQSQGYYNSTASVNSPGYAQYAGSVPYQVRYYDVGVIFCREPARQVP